MEEKQKKTLLFVTLGIIIVIILMNPGCKNILGGANNNTGGNTPSNGQTVYVHDECSKCQARWNNLISWECTGTCDNGGTCAFDINSPHTNPYQKPTDCSCRTQTTGDTCYVTGGYTNARTCGGTCADTGKTCQATITGTCTCQTRPKMCSEITAILKPSDCADASCPITGQACQYDTGRGICACMGTYL
jgi:hypothetical protein